MDKGRKVQDNVKPESHEQEEKWEDELDSSSSLKSVKNDDSNLTSEAVSLMRKMLPPHIVNCFLQTGYDTLDVLAEINNESIAEIEEIINSDYPNETCFRHQPVPMSVASLPVFKFSPGHRKRILKFVEEIKRLISARQKDDMKASAQRKRLGKRSNNAISAGIKHARVSNDVNISTSLGINDSAENEDYSELDLLTDFRQSFAKWQRQTKNMQYGKIKENQDFTVNISVSTPGNTKASVHCCTCGKTEQLGIKSGKVLLSNWYRHIQHFCRKKSGSKSLDSFFTVTASKKSVDLASQTAASVTTVNKISPTITDERKLCNHACGTVLHNS